MYNIFLDVYFGSKLAESINTNSTINSIFTSNSIVYAAVIILGILFISIFAFFIVPRIFRNPQNYFNRYIVIREEMEKVDELYSRKKINFEDYAFAQFHYAKEYEMIITYLSKFPDYKAKLQSYKLSTVKAREAEDFRLDNKEKQQLNIVNYMVDILKPSAVYYKKDEIYQALLDEGYKQDIADAVVNKLDVSGIEFASQEKNDNNRILDLVDTLLASKKQSNRENQNTSINLKDLSITKKQDKLTFGEKATTFSRYSEYQKPPKKETAGIFSAIKGLFKPKEKTHSISEINDIFKDIEYTLKEKK